MAILSIQERIHLFRVFPFFSFLNSKSLEMFAVRFEESHFSPGSVIVHEGEAGDRAFIVAEGAAEVSVSSPEGATVLASLSAGEFFGEMALFSESGKRTATVTAVTPMRLLSISAASFKKFLDETPEVRSYFESLAQFRLTMNFLKFAASPFSSLPHDQFRELAARLKTLSVAAKQDIVRQGEEGDSCFIVKKGEVEVVLQPGDGTERQIAVLGPGAIFGEAALLTTARRNATVRAMGSCDLLVLERRDLLEVIGKHADTGIQMRELLQMRARPRQRPGILVVENKSRSGEKIIILKDPVRHTYYRLSTQGWFIWQRLDGEHSLKDLTLEYMREFKAFAPQAILEIVSGLTREGFAENPSLRSDVRGTVTNHPGAWQRFVQSTKKIMEFQVAIKNVDGFFSFLYRCGVWILFTPFAQILLAFIAIAGLGVFFMDLQQTRNIVSAGREWLLLWIIPAEIASLLLHEAGHAFTTKACGREIHRVGVGWYWFGMVAFVDTSDMWLASRWQRIAVSFAGPYTNFLLGSLAAILGHFSADPVLQAVLWQFAAMSYLFALINLDPLLEFDGYYIMTDFFDRPNLRRQALAWLGNGLIPNLTNGKVLREHAFELVYGLGAFLYVIGMGFATIVFYRIFIQEWCARWIPTQAASGLAWLFAGGIMIFSLASVLGEITSCEAPSRHSNRAAAAGK